MTDARRLRAQIFADLLVRPGLVDLLDGFRGPVTATRLRESIEAAGIEGIDELDIDVLEVELVSMRESGEHLARDVGPGIPLSLLFPPHSGSATGRGGARWTGGGT